MTRARNFNSYNTGTVWSPDSNRVVAGSPNGPTEILSPAGKVLATIRQNSLFPVGWTRGAIYLLPGPDARRQSRQTVCHPGRANDRPSHLQASKASHLSDKQPF